MTAEPSPSFIPIGPVAGAGPAAAPSAIGIPPPSGPPGGPAAGPSSDHPPDRQVGQRPPAPPPPPAWTAAPGSGALGQGPIEPEPATDASTPRRHPRHSFNGDPPARIALANRQPVFVTLNDISSGGCCIVRKGQLELANGDSVLVDLWTDDISSKLSLHARVCWCSHQDTNSRAGLRFIETNHRMLRQLESYVQHFRRPVDDSRPLVKLPINKTEEPQELPPLPPQPDVAISAHRPQSADRAAEPSQLSSMPRPGQLSSLGLQSRMRPAHRLEVARIAEETGIHIQTLYSWLRSLQLEGDVSAERPHDPEAWSATDKVSALLKVTGMTSDERAAYCSRHGIEEEQLERWRQAALQANEKPLLILRAEEELQRLRLRDQSEIRRLQKQLRRRERSAAISGELLQVVRKLQILWEQGEGQ